jgi:coatomer subunit delta
MDVPSDDSFPLYRTGSYPTVASHTGEWALNPSNHSLDWSVAMINSDNRSGTLEFTVGGDDASAFFPVKVSFIGQGSLSGLSVGSVTLVDGGDVPFSQETVIAVDNYTVVG